MNTPSHYISHWTQLNGIPLSHLDKFCHFLNQHNNTFLSHSSDLEKLSTTDSTSLISDIQNKVNSTEAEISNLLNLSAQPFLKCYSSDEFHAKSIAIKCFNNIALMLHNKQSVNVVKLICEAIIQIYTRKDEKNKDFTKDLQPVTSEFCQSVIDNSDVLNIFLDSITKSLKDEVDKSKKASASSESATKGEDATTSTHAQMSPKSEKKYYEDFLTKLKYELKVVQMIVTSKNETVYSEELISNCYSACSIILRWIFSGVKKIKKN